jgi:hypothetical protein
MIVAKEGKIFQKIAVLPYDTAAARSFWRADHNPLSSASKQSKIATRGHALLKDHENVSKVYALGPFDRVARADDCHRNGAQSCNRGPKQNVAGWGTVFCAREPIVGPARSMPGQLRQNPGGLIRIDSGIAQTATHRPKLPSKRKIQDDRPRHG